MFKNMLPIVIVCFLCISCSSETNETQKLRQQITEKQKAIQELQHNIAEVSASLSNIWLRSLKYRFADVHKITTPDEISINSQDVPYLKGIRFKYLNRHNQIQVVCNYKTPKKVRLGFYIYLFDNQGVNIHRESISSYFSIGKDKLIEKKYKLKCASNTKPTHFLIRKISS